jgi:hypothetical protein
MSTTDIKTAQAGQPGRINHDDSQDRELGDLEGNTRPASEVAACFAEVRSPNGMVAPAQGSASATKRAEMARQHRGSAGPQAERAAFLSAPDQTQSILSNFERSLGSRQDRTRTTSNMTGRL